MYKHAVIDLLNEYSVLKRKANFSWKRAKELKQKLAEIENEGVIYEEIYNEYLECCRDYYKAQKAVSETEYYLSFLEYEVNEIELSWLLLTGETTTLCGGFSKSFQ